MNRNAYTPITADPVLLRLNSCRDWGALHQRIRKAFGFPDYYGENWDAMWDCLTDVFLQPVQKAAAHMVKHKGQYQGQQQKDPAGDKFSDFNGKSRCRHTRHLLCFFHKATPHNSRLTA